MQEDVIVENDSVKIEKDCCPVSLNKKRVRVCFSMFQEIVRTSHHFYHFLKLTQWIGLTSVLNKLLNWIVIS